MKHLRVLVCLLALPFTNLLAQTLPVPIAYYPFNSTFRNEANTLDTLGTGTDVGFTTDSRGNALAAGYYNGHQSLFTGLTLSTSTPNLTISSVIMPYSNLQQTGLFLIGSSTQSGFGVSIKKASGNAFGNNLLIYGGGRFEVGDTNVGKVEAFQWHHIVFTKRLDTLSLYLNGQRIFRTTRAYNPATSPLFLGSTPQHIQLMNSSFHGIMDETRVWNSALDSTQISELYLTDLSTVSQQSIGVLRGQVYMDLNSNCTFDSTETGLAGQSLLINPGGVVMPLSATGTFIVPVASDTTYTITVLPKRFFELDSICATTARVVAGDTASVQIGVQGRQCALLNVSLGTSVRRRCFKTSSSVQVENLGSGPSDSATTLVLEYPKEVWARSFSPVQPYITILGTDSVAIYYFRLPSIAGGQRFYLYTVDSTVCRDSLMGVVVCNSAKLIGGSGCSPTASGWDRADLIAGAKCDPDSVGYILLTIKNQGQGSMLLASQLTILAGDGIVRQQSFRLSAGDSIVFRVRDQGEYWAISSPQTTGHPSGGSALAAWGGCNGGINSRAGDHSTLLFALGLGDESPTLDIDCMPIVDSYDPNDKLVTPEGIGPNRVVAPKTQLEYKIRFENKGTASTVFVAIRDTLTSNLDVATFERGAESHPGAQISTYKFGEKYIVQWSFPSLELTPSSVNEAASQGFVTFRISPISTLALGTEVANKAGIFFDYNRPVVTDPVKVKFDNLPVTTVPNPVIEPVSAKKKVATSRLVLAPNPAHGSVYLSLRSATATEKIGYVLHDVIGREVGRGTVSGKGGTISLAGMHEGIYMITLKAGSVSETRKLVVE